MLRLASAHRQRDGLNILAQQGACLLQGTSLFTVAELGNAVPAAALPQHEIGKALHQRINEVAMQVCALYSAKKTGSRTILQQATPR